MTNVTYKDLAKGTQKFSDRITADVEVGTIKKELTDNEVFFSSEIKSESSSSKYDVEIVFILDLKADRSIASGDKPIDLKTSHIKVGCSCRDYAFTFAFSNQKVDSNLIKIEPYEKKTDRKPRNPDLIVGFCKHISGVVKKLVKDKIILV